MRNHFSRFALVATLGFAITFTLSCEPSLDNGDLGGSSVTYGPSVDYGGETYQTVVIGTQTWMARNLNYNAGSSKCYSNSASNCTKYGRLYDWATAMNLPSSCNSSSCASQIGANHRGICPSGWHIPSNADWDKLFKFVDNANGDFGYENSCATGTCYYSDQTANRYLMARSGWHNNGNGFDTYGFSALPGGYYSDYGFTNAGREGRWWSSSENGSDYAYLRNMYYNSEGVSYNHNDDKYYLLSVRCVQDSPGTLSSSSSVPSSSSTAVVASNCSLNGGTVTIGSQVWMSENLNCNVAGSKCYNNNASNCATYGRLYDWATAMGIDAKYNSQEWGGIDVKHRGICPSGWHIPSDAEWIILTDYVGSSTAGTKLKARSGWNEGGNGTDNYGFSALPGGGGIPDGSFVYVGLGSLWWSASESISINAYYRGMYYDYEYARWSSSPKDYFFSIRCLQD